MAKALLLSMIGMMIGLPIFMARDASPRRGLVKTVISVVVFNVAYFFAIKYIYPRLR